MSTAAPTFGGSDTDSLGAAAAPPLTPVARRAIFGSVLAASLLAHGATIVFLLAADTLEDWTPTASQEIPVELLLKMPEVKPAQDGPAKKGAALGAGQSDAATSAAAASPGQGGKQEAPQSAPQPKATPSQEARATPTSPAPVPDPKPTPEKPVQQAQPIQKAAAAAKPVPAPPPPPAPPPAPAATSPGLTTAFGPLPGSFNAIVLPSSSIGGQEAFSYRALVFSQIAKAKHFPEAARARGASGVAVVAFNVDDAGNPTGITLARSSGDPDIDAEIIAMVGRAAPFPPPPQGAQRSFDAAIEFGHDE